MQSEVSGCILRLNGLVNPPHTFIEQAANAVTILPICPKGPVYIFLTIYLHIKTSHETNKSVPSASPLH